MRQTDKPLLRLHEGNTTLTGRVPVQAAVLVNVSGLSSCPPSKMTCLALAVTSSLGVLFIQQASQNN